MVVECTLLSLFSRKRMLSCRGIAAFLCSCFVLLLAFFLHFNHAMLTSPSVLTNYVDDKKYYIGGSWLIILILFLIAELLPWIGVWLVSDLKDTSKQSYIGGAVDTLSQLVSFVGIVYYLWICFLLSFVGLRGESFTQYYSTFRMAAIIVCLWIGVMIYSGNLERNERIYTKRGKDTSYCDVNGAVIRGYDRVSYYGSSFSVTFANGKWILIPSMPGMRKQYTLSEAAADIAGHLIKVKE